MSRFHPGGQPLLLFGLAPPPDPEHMPIRMAKVHLANVPRHIGGRKCDLQPGGHAMLMHLVHVVHPDRHPDALVALFVSVLLKGGGVRAAASASLCPLTKKDARFLTRSNRAKLTRAKPGGVPQSRNSFHPHFSNHATVLAMSDTFTAVVNSPVEIRPPVSLLQSDLCNLLYSPSELATGFTCPRIHSTIPPKRNSPVSIDPLMNSYPSAASTSM